MKKIQRIDTGIPGLNELVEGGFIKGKSVLVSGTTGTGKTTFSIQFLCAGSNKGEPGVLVTLGEAKEHLFGYMSRFGWDLESLIAKKRLSIIDATPMPKGGSSIFYIADAPDMKFNIDAVSGLVLDEIKRVNASRVAIDSITAMLLAYPDAFALRHELLALINMLERTGCTSILTNEVLSDELYRYGLVEFVTHGLIELSYPVIKNEHVRTLTVRKMRGTAHDKGVYLYDMGEGGIRITSKAEYLE